VRAYVLLYVLLYVNLTSLSPNIYCLRDLLYTFPHVNWVSRTWFAFLTVFITLCFTCMYVLCTHLKRVYMFGRYKVLNLTALWFTHSIWIFIHLFFSGAFAKLQKATISFVMSIRPFDCLSAFPSEWDNSASTGRIFMKFDIWEFFENPSRKLKFYIYYIWRLILQSKVFKWTFPTIPLKIFDLIIFKELYKNSCFSPFSPVNTRGNTDKQFRTCHQLEQVAQSCVVSQSGLVCATVSTH
jgi:hypothetical protein